MIDVDRITGFIIGGFSSRFWMFRKYMNTIEFDPKKPLPFYAWQCLTIQLDNSRDVNLVIPNEKSMNRLLFFLSFKINERLFF